MATPQRRKTDTGHLAQFLYLLKEGDIRMVLILAGFGLLVWSALGVYKFSSDLEAYAAMFPVGNGTFWVVNYLFCGLAMWHLAVTNLPPTRSQLIGLWLTTVWFWSFWSKYTAMSSQQTGNANSIVYIFIGFLVLHRSKHK